MNIDNDRHCFDFKGKRAEQIIYELAEKTFMTDWCFRNPKLSTSNKELCDLMVVFGDMAIVMTVANIAFKGNIERFRRKSIEHNLKQIKGAYSKLTRLKDTINLVSPVRGKETLNPNMIKTIHMIAICVGAGKIPFWGCEVYKGKLIHVFDEISSTVIFNELDTVVDFCKYIEAKENLLMKDNFEMVINGGEEELLAYYLQQGRQFNKLQRVNRFYIDGGSWQRLKRSLAYKSKMKADLISYGWDTIINYRRESETATSEKIIRELANTTRLERRMLAQELIECKTEAERKNLIQMRRCFTLNGRTFVYLVVEHDMERDLRRQMLALSCFVARGVYKNNHKVMGIATDRSGSPAYAYDFCLLYKPEWTEHDETFAEQLKVELGIFKNPRKTLQGFDEYPLGK